MKTDVGRLRVARAVARGEAASSALDEAVAKEGEKFRADVEQAPGSQGENGASVDDSMRVQESANPFECKRAENA